MNAFEFSFFNGEIEECFKEFNLFEEIAESLNEAIECEKGNSHKIDEN